MQRTIVVAGLCAALGLQGCATVDPANDTRTQVEKAMATCVGTVAAGAILGAIIGNNSGSGNARRGAVIGAAAGAGACAVLLAMANEKDKQQIAQLQMAAAANGGTRQTRYVGDDGATRTITAVAGPVVQRVAVTPSGAEASRPKICRPVSVNLDVAGKGQADVPQELYCRNPQTRVWAREVPEPDVRAKV